MKLMSTTGYTLAMVVQRRRVIHGRIESQNLEPKMKHFPRSYGSAPAVGIYQGLNVRTGSRSLGPLSLLLTCSVRIAQL